MSTEVRYRVVHGSIRMPRAITGKVVHRASNFIGPGELLPPGVFPETDLRGWLKEGRIEVWGPQSEESGEQPITARGPWSVDPASLAGKSLEDLLILVLEIDPDYEVAQIQSEGDAIRQLTADWDPRYAQPVAKAIDRTRPEERAVGQDNVRAGGAREMSAQAQAALESAKQRAAAPEPAPKG